MTFDEYQKAAGKTAIYPGRKNALTGDLTGLYYTVMGLCGESGEIAEKTKKLIRDSKGKITPEFREKLAMECSDVLWYLSQILEELDISFDFVAKKNIEKLYSRMERGKIKGSGDER